MTWALREQNSHLDRSSIWWMDNGVTAFLDGILGLGWLCFHESLSQIPHSNPCLKTSSTGMRGF